MVTCKIILEKDSQSGQAIPGHIKAVKAPNGKRSLLFDNIKKYLQGELKDDISRVDLDAKALEVYYRVYTPEFKAWFGDWEILSLARSLDKQKGVDDYIDGLDFRVTKVRATDSRINEWFGKTIPALEDFNIEDPNTMYSDPVKGLISGLDFMIENTIGSHFWALNDYLGQYYSEDHPEFQGPEFVKALNTLGKHFFPSKNKPTVPLSDKHKDFALQLLDKLVKEKLPKVKSQLETWQAKHEINLEELTRYLSPIVSLENMDNVRSMLLNESLNELGKTLMHEDLEKVKKSFSLLGKDSNLTLDANNEPLMSMLSMSDIKKETPNLVYNHDFIGGVEEGKDMSQVYKDLGYTHFDDVEVIPSGGTFMEHTYNIMYKGKDIGYFTIEPSWDLSKGEDSATVFPDNRGVILQSEIEDKSLKGKGIGKTSYLKLLLLNPNLVQGTGNTVTDKARHIFTKAKEDIAKISAKDQSKDIPASEKVSESLADATESIMKSISKRVNKPLAKVYDDNKIEKVDFDIDRDSVINHILTLVGGNIDEGSIEILAQTKESNFTIPKKYIKNFGLKENDYFLAKVLNEDPTLQSSKRITNDKGVKLSIRDSIASKIETKYNDLIKNIGKSSYVISEVSDSYLKFAAMVAENNGEFDQANRLKRLDDWERMQLKDRIKEFQLSDFKPWVKYLKSRKDYPIEFKYHVLSSMIKSNVVDVDIKKKKVRLSKRTKSSVDSFESFNAGGIADVFDNPQSSNKFLVDYSLSLADKYSKLAPPEKIFKRTNKGVWYKFTKGDGEMLSLFVKDTPWCTKNSSTANTQLNGGDFYVFNPTNKDEDEKIAIRLERGDIKEIRGTLGGQDLKDTSSPIVNSFIKEHLPGQDSALNKLKYLKLRASFKKDPSLFNDYEKTLNLIHYSQFNDSYGEDSVLSDNVEAIKKTFAKFIRKTVVEVTNKIDERTTANLSTFLSLSMETSNGDFYGYSAEEIFSSTEVFVDDIFGLPRKTGRAATPRSIWEDVKNIIDGKWYIEYSNTDSANELILIGGVEGKSPTNLEELHEGEGEDSLRGDMPLSFYNPYSHKVKQEIDSHTKDYTILTSYIQKSKSLTSYDDIVNNIGQEEIIFKPAYAAGPEKVGLIGVKDKLNKILKKEGLTLKDVQLEGVGTRFSLVMDNGGVKKVKAHPLDLSLIPKKLYSKIDWAGGWNQLHIYNETRFEEAIDAITILTTEFENIPKIGSIKINTKATSHKSISETIDFMKEYNLDKVADELVIEIDTLVSDEIINIPSNENIIIEYNIETITDYHTLPREFEHEGFKYARRGRRGRISYLKRDISIEEKKYSHEQAEELYGITYDDFYDAAEAAENITLWAEVDKTGYFIADRFSMWREGKKISKIQIPVIKNGKVRLLEENPYDGGDEIRNEITFKNFKSTKPISSFEQSMFRLFSLDDNFYNGLLYAKISDLDEQANLRKKAGKIDIEYYESLYQNIEKKILGAFTKISEDKSLILLHKDSNVTTPLHELTHLWETVLTSKEKRAILSWTGDAAWTVNTSEQFAKGFERYVYEGVKTGNKEVDALFEKFAKWFRSVIKYFNKYFKGSELNQEIKDIYNKMLTEGSDLKEKTSSLYRRQLLSLYAYLDDSVEQESAVKSEKSAKGKGTLAGDTKDQKMRSVSVGFIGEINPHSNKAGASSTFGSFKSFEEAKYNKNIQGHRTVASYPENTNSGNKIMLALNGSLGTHYTELSNQTKTLIHDLHEQGFEFVLGDMPSTKNRFGDDTFIKYLEQIDAKFTVYGNGSKSRLKPPAPKKLKETGQLIETRPDFKPGITKLENGNYLFRAYRTDNAGGRSKGMMQQGRGLYLSLDTPYQGDGVNTIEIELDPSKVVLASEDQKNVDLNEDEFISWTKVDSNDFKKPIEDRYTDAGAYAVIADIGAGGRGSRELVLFDPEIIKEAMGTKTYIADTSTIEDDGIIFYNKKESAKPVFTNPIGDTLPIVNDDDLKGRTFNMRGPIKGGVDKIFKDNPELINIGTPQQYSRYLDSIFPDSKIKDIVYHSGPKKIEKFIFEEGEPVFFAPSEHPWTSKGTEITSALLNIERPIRILNNQKISNIPNHLSDGAIVDFTGDYIDALSYDLREGHEFTVERLVYKSEQIHILGSKKDIKGFKDFIKNSKFNLLRPKGSVPYADRFTELYEEYKDAITEEQKTDNFDDFVDFLNIIGKELGIEKAESLVKVMFNEGASIIFDRDVSDSFTVFAGFEPKVDFGHASVEVQVMEEIRAFLESADNWAEEVKDNHDAELRNKYFSDGDFQSHTDILRKIISNEHPLSALAQKLLDNSSEDVIVELVSNTATRDGGGASGTYYGDEHRIEIAEFINYNLGDSEHVIIHEIVHALTVDAIDNLEATDPLYEAIRDIFMAAIDNEDVFRNTYGLSNIHEFIAETISNKEFMEDLQKLPSIGLNKSLFQDFMEWVKEMLGLDGKTRTLFDDAMYVSIKLIEKNAETIQNKTTNKKEGRKFNYAPFNDEVTTPELDIKNEYVGKIIFASSGIGKSYAAALNDRIIDSDNVYASVLGVPMPDFHKKLLSLTREEGAMASDTVRAILLQLKNAGFTIVTPTEKFLNISDYAFIQEDPEKMAASTRSNLRDNPYAQSVVKAKERINRYKKNVKRAGLEPILLDRNNHLSNYIFKDENPIKFLSDTADKQLDKQLVSYLANFGIGIMEMQNIKETLKIDSLGFVDILNKTGYIEEGNTEALPDITGRFIAHMMQYNPLVTDIYKDLRETFPHASKNEILEEIGIMISDRFKGKETTRMDINSRWEKRWFAPQKIYDIIQKFLVLLRLVDIKRLNINIGIITQKILEDDTNLITASKYKPGAQGKPVSKVSLLRALRKDPFAEHITNILAEDGFLLTGSVTLAEQGSVFRPTENQVHDLDWVSPYDRDTTKKKFLKHWPNATFVREIINEGTFFEEATTTDTWLIVPKGYELKNIEIEGDRRKVRSYDIVNKSTGVTEGSYLLVDETYTASDGSTKTKEIEKIDPDLFREFGIEAKLIDFFTYMNLEHEDTKTDIFKELRSGVQLGMSTWKTTFGAKLRYSRLKDIWDYNRFIPLDEYRNLIDNATEYNSVTNNVATEKLTTNQLYAELASVESNIKKLHEAENKFLESESDDVSFRIEATAAIVEDKGAGRRKLGFELRTKFGATIADKGLEIYDLEVEKSPGRLTQSAGQMILVKNLNRRNENADIQEQIEEKTKSLNALLDKKADMEMFEIENIEKQIRDSIRKFPFDSGDGFHSIIDFIYDDDGNIKRGDESGEGLHGDVTLALEILEAVILGGAGTKTESVADVTVEDANGLRNDDGTRVQFSSKTSVIRRSQKLNSKYIDSPFKFEIEEVKLPGEKTHWIIKVVEDHDDMAFSTREAEASTPKGQLTELMEDGYQIELTHFKNHLNRFGHTEGQIEVLEKYNREIAPLLRKGKTETGLDVVDGNVEVDLNDLGLPYKKRRVLAKRGKDKFVVYASRGKKGFISLRVTMNQDINYLSKRTEDKIKEQEENPISQLSKEMGTQMHAINELVVNGVVRNPTGIFNVEGEGDVHENLTFSIWNENNQKIDAFKKTSEYKKIMEIANKIFQTEVVEDELGDEYTKTSPEQMADKLILSMIAKYHKIHVTQHKINVEINKNIKDPAKHVFHKPIILVETPLLDKHADEAGTMDLLVIYSDKSAGIFDHKFTNLKLQKVDLEESRLSREELYKLRDKQGLSTSMTKKNDWAWMAPKGAEMYEKEQSWNMQIGRYAQMLLKLYGVTKIRQARILPVHTTYTKIKTGNVKTAKGGKKYKEEVYDVDKSKVAFIITNEDVADMLEIPLEVERTGDKSLDQFIASLIRQKKAINQERIDKKAWQDPKYLDRINRLDQSIKGLLRNRDVTYIAKSIATLADNIEQSLDEVGDNEITFEDIISYLNEANMYDTFTGAASNQIKEMKKQEEKRIKEGEEIPDSESYSAFENELRNATYKIIDLRERLQNKMISMLASVNQKEGFMSDKMFKSFDSQVSMTKMGVYFTHLKSSNHPLVSMFSKMLEEIDTRQIKERQQLEKELKPISTKLKEWGNNQGLKGVQIYDKIIDKYNNLIRRYSSEMREDLKEYSGLMDEENRASSIKWFNDTFQRSKVGEKLFQKKYKAIQDYYQSITRTKEEYDTKINEWLSKNDIKHNDGDNDAWQSSYGWFMLEPKNPDSYYSDEYKELLKPSNKPLLNFYNFYTNQMNKLAEKADFAIKENMIAEIRKDTMDTIVQNGFFTGMSQQYRNIVNFFTEHDKDQGFQTLENGKQVPIFFMDSVGKGNKSLDLHKSLVIFSDFVHNYSGVKNIEHAVLSMKHLVDTTDAIKRGKFGRKVRGSSNTLEIDTTSSGKNIVEAMDTWVNYYVYGIRHKGEKTTWHKVVETALSVGSRKNMALNWLSATAGHVNGESQLTMLARKGLNMTEKSLSEARKIVKGRGSKLEILRSAKEEVGGVTSKFGYVSMFFEMAQESMTYETANRLSLDDMRSKLNRDYAYFMQRWSDDVIDNTVLITMMKEHAIDPNTGKAYPISKLKRVYKDHPEYGGDFEWQNLWDNTIMETQTITLSDGTTKEIIIDNFPKIINQHTGEAIDDKTYSNFRSKARQVVADAKGQMSSDDIAGYKVHMIGKLGMQYRGWIPATIRERAKGEQYNLTMEQFEVGRWMAGYHMVVKNGKKTWQDLLKLVMPFMDSDLEVIKNDYMLNQYNNYIADNPHLEPDPYNPSIESVSFDEYIETYKGEIRALAREVQTYLALAGAYIAFGLVVGDDEIKENPIFARMSTLIERSMLEIGFFVPVVGAFETIKMAKRAPFPVISVLDDTWKTLSNTVGESKDLLSGTPWDRKMVLEDGWEWKWKEKKDKHPNFYYTVQWIPGAKSLTKFWGTFETNKHKQTMWDFIWESDGKDAIYK